MRSSATAVLLAGVAAGLIGLPPHADAATRRPVPGLTPRVPADPPRLEPPEAPFHPDIDRRFWPDRDDSPFSEGMEPVPDFADMPGPRIPKRHRVRPVPRWPSLGASDRHLRFFRERRVVEHVFPARPWPVVVGAVCVDIDVVVVVRMIVRVRCHCRPPAPPHHARPPAPKPSPKPAPRRHARRVIAERPRPPASRPRPPVAPKAPSPSVAPPTHRAMAPKAALPQRRKNPLGTLMVLVVLTVVISAGAGIAFAGAR